MLSFYSEQNISDIIALKIIIIALGTTYSSKHVTWISSFQATVPML
jgi:hypothetical protein